jgi:putative membrane protein insertion efficiency factor
MAKVIGLSSLDSLLAESTKVLIQGYQLTRIFRCSCCRFYPSCSDYCLQALDAYGFVKGIIASLKRLAKCHPWHPGGVDVIQIETVVGQLEPGKEPCKMRSGCTRRDEWNEIEAALI